MKQAVLAIWIKRKLISQGKYCQIDGKDYFIANMTAVKLWRNYNGYGIAKRILDSFSENKLRPTIIYKREDLNQYYITKPSKFTTKGIGVKYGDHQQWVLPLKNWEWKEGRVKNEPSGLPVIDLAKWEKSEEKPEQPIYGDYSMPANIFVRAYKQALMKKGLYV